MPWRTIIAMKAIPLQRMKRSHHGGIVEINVWRVSEPVPPCTHHCKYRLVYVVDGRRLVGFDNERGKGDHRHVGDEELPYDFINVEKLLTDFWQAVGDWI